MKVLFINHSASRTGAPIVLLHFLTWLRKNNYIYFDVLTLQHEELLEEFTSISDCHFYDLKKETLLNKAINLTKYRKSKLKTEKLLYSKRSLKAIARNNYDLIYANTVLSIPAGNFIKKNSLNAVKLLVHFHELDATINQYCPQLNYYISNIDCAIGVSEKVKENLVANWGFPKVAVKVVYAHSQISNVRKKFVEEFIIGSSGIVDWRKGPDFFLLVADYVSKKLPNAPIKFKWVGRISNLNRLIFEKDILRLNLLNKVEFTGVKDNPHDYFSQFDVFLMTSKEDPFPLVCVEVGMMGIPMICFEGATGTEEVLKDVEGTVVPYLDVAKMGEMVIRYYNDLDFKVENGKKIKQIFQEFTPSEQGAKLLEIMTDLVED